MKLTTGSIYTLAIILFLVSIPFILIGSIVGIVREARRVRVARSQGDKLSYAQPRLLADVATLLFILILIAAGAIYGSIYYKLLSANVLWVSIVLVILAAVCGIFAFVQRMNPNNAQKLVE
jgi:O-antigen/teichoic acid export membrane protein